MSEKYDLSIARDQWSNKDTMSYDDFLDAYEHGTPELKNAIDEFFSDLGYEGIQEARKGLEYSTFINRYFWIDYCKEFCEECGAIDPRSFLYCHVDWQGLADDMEMNYASGEVRWAEGFLGSVEFLTTES